MQSYRKEIRTKLLKYGSLREIIKKFGVVAIIDSVISNFLSLISKRFYRSNSVNYGLSEALFRSRDIDRWSRYIRVINEIRKIKGKELSVLDVGSGGQSISCSFLNQLKWNYFLRHVRRDVLKNLKKERTGLLATVYCFRSKIKPST